MAKENESSNENSQQIPKVVGPEFLVQFVRRTVKTIKVDANRRPESLPPRLKIPGSTQLLWLESDVLDWIQSLREVKEIPKSKGGRPSLVMKNERRNLIV